MTEQTGSEGSLITLIDVTKKYNGRSIIDGVSHTFKKGESVAFYGHNGCGKSTMLKLLGGLISLSGGKIQYSKKLKFSYVPEKFAGMEIAMADYLHGIADIEGEDRKVADDLIHVFFTDPMVKTRMDKLSKGSLQKVGVIQALMAPGDVLLLDEPLSGQDEDSQKVFISKVNDLRQKGVTIFMSCHEKKLIDELSDSVYTIEQGKLARITLTNETVYKISVRYNDALKMWPEMTARGNRCELRTEEARLKERVMRLYEDGWEIVGIEECDRSVENEIKALV